MYKILTIQEFQEIEFNSSSLWKGTAVDLVDDFIHLCNSSQIVMLANRFFSSHPSLEILKFSIQSIENPNLLKWEQGEKDSRELFPHLYGGLNLINCLAKIHWEKSSDLGIYENPFHTIVAGNH